MPTIGALDVRYKTYHKRHQELQNFEEKHEAIWKRKEEVNQANGEDAVAYNKLIVGFFCFFFDDF